MATCGLFEPCHKKQLTSTGECVATSTHNRLALTTNFSSNKFPLVTEAGER